MKQIEIPFPTGQAPTALRVADWVELTTLAGRSPFKRGDLKTAIDGEDIGEPDRLVEDTWAELTQRAALISPSWPLRLKGGRLTVKRRSPVPVRLYRFLCVLSLNDLIDNSDRKLFEEIVAYILEALFGSHVLRVGHPASIGQDRSFRVRLDSYVVRAGIHADERLKPVLSTDNDLGLDVVGWKKFSDGRGGGMHYWAQCATGLDWEEKLDDASIGVWSDHLSLVGIIRLFVTPFTILVPSVKFHRIGKRCGVVVDRPRLLELARAVHFPPSVLSELDTRYKELVGV